MKNIAVIPARSGSKRLKNKNIKKLLDLELFLWTIRAANASKDIDRIIFSTDSKKYVEISKKDNLLRNYSCEIDFRNEKEAGDKIKIFDYISSERFIEKNKISHQDRLILLLPTCPLRPKGLIDSAIKYANECKSSIFSCCEYDFHINFAFSIMNKKPFKFEALFGKDSPMLSGNTRSQDQKKFFRPNGSFFINKVSEIINPEAKSIYFQSLPYEMNRIYSCDIDDEVQLKIASSVANIIKDEFDYILKNI